MSNHSRSIIHLPLNIHSPSPPDGILRVHLLLLLLSAATPYATAQSTTSSSEDQYESDDSINPSMATIMVVIVCAFFVMGIFTLYIRKCADSALGNSRAFRVANGRPLQLQRGLDPSVIGSFPVFVYSEVKDIKIGKGALECAVCLSEFEGDENLRLLPKCDHVFHPECIDVWLASHTTCPVCRNDLTLISREFDGDIEQRGESNESMDEQNPRSEISEIQDQVSISVDDDRGRDAQVGEITKRSETQKQSRRGAKKFPRSHSTGHSVLVLPGENRERYTLRLPEEFRKEMMTRRLKRTRSCVIVLPREESSRRGYRSGGEGSSRGRRVAWLSERLGRSDRWAFTMTPPFFARSTGSVRSPKVYSDGVEKSSAKTPVDCHSGKGDGVEKSSSPLPV